MLFIESNDEAMSYFSNIPKEYQEVEYINSTYWWNQRISTWYYANSNMRFITEFMFWWNANWTDDVVYWSTDWSWRRWNPLCFAWSWTNFHFWAQHWDDFWAIADRNVKHTFDYNVSRWILDWTTYTYNSWNSGNLEITLLYWNWKWGNVRIYSFKIYTWETLERDFIPCYRKQDWVIWLYDKVSETFFTNSWSWTFWKWHDVNVKRSEFQKVEYIWTSWTQRIDTWIRPDNTSFWFTWKISVSSMWWWVWAPNILNLWWTSVDNYRYWFWLHDWKFHWWWIMYTEFGDVWSITQNEVFEFTYNYNSDRKLTKNWSDVKTDIPTWSYTYWVNWNIFTQAYWSWSYDRYFYWNLYYMKIYEWSELVRDFIPCYRKSDWVIGMIDDVNKVFYTNDWTWTFTKWWDIN